MEIVRAGTPAYRAESKDNNCSNPAMENADAKENYGFGGTSFCTGVGQGGNFLPAPASYSIEERQLHMQMQMWEMQEALNSTINRVKKFRKKKLSSTINIDSRGRFFYVKAYDDGSNETQILLLNVSGKIDVKLILIADRYEFFVIQIGGEFVLIGDMSELKRESFYNLWMQNAELNPMISDKEAADVLYKYFAPMIIASTQKIIFSGLAGWEDGKFHTAEKFAYLRRYWKKMDLPILKKHFDLDASDPARISDYTDFFMDVADPKNRVLVALIAFGGITYSWFREMGIVPPVLNFIWMDSKVPINKLINYIQFFNRDEGLKCYSLSDSDKRIDIAVEETKDEVLIFEGIAEADKKYYASNKIKANLERIARKLLEQQGVVYGRSGARALGVLISDSFLQVNGVQQIFVDSHFFVTENRAFHNSTAVEAVWALFIQYVTTYNVKKFADNIAKQEKYDCEAERYWKCLIDIVDRFFRAVGTSMYEVYRLTNDFCYDFLWTEEEEVEDGPKLVIRKMREAMPEIVVTSKSCACGNETFLYDEEHIWLLPVLFDSILERCKLLKQKNHLLMQCKESGLLITKNYDTYATRLCIAGERREYYCFLRKIFTRIGEIELIDLAREEEQNA